VRLERLGILKRSNDFIGNRNRDFPACSTVPQRDGVPPFFTSVFLKAFSETRYQEHHLSNNTSELFSTILYEFLFFSLSSSSCILWYADLMLGNDREISNYTRAVAK
jgi:hypothetical protein